jgi:hypothetical protein
MISLEDHIVESRYDSLTGLCHYVVLHEGERYTVSVPLAELDKHPPAGRPTDPGSRLRRAHLARLITERLKGEPDPAPAATKPQERA